jgi:hypothetical protein
LVQFPRNGWKLVALQTGASQAGIGRLSTCQAIDFAEYPAVSVDQQAFSYGSVSIGIFSVYLGLIEDTQQINGVTGQARNPGVRPASQ